MFAIRAMAAIFILSLFAGANAFAQDPQQDFRKTFKREMPIELFNGQEFSLGVSGGEAALECYRGMKLSEMFYFANGVNLYFRENGIEVDDPDGVLSIGLTEVRCRPRSDSAIVTFNNHAFRGYLRAVYESVPAGILLINVVDLEDYIKGVLPGEIGDRTVEEYEAVKAQAIAARTYAVWKMTDQGASGRLASTIADQLYTGADSEKGFLSRGVDDTRGQIMTFKGSPIAAYYHAVCGGQTAPIEEIWPEKHSEAYLKGVNDDDNCKWAKSYSWTETFTIAGLQENLAKYFTDKGTVQPGAFGNIRDIEFTLDKEIGRIKTMQVYTNFGVFKETSDHIRWALGRPSVPGAILPSTRFRAEKQFSGNALVGLTITGTGNGHGVGMCQCGAIGQSRTGQKCDDLLKFYYKHIKIEKIY